MFDITCPIKTIFWEMTGQGRPISALEPDSLAADLSLALQLSESSGNSDMPAKAT